MELSGEQFAVSLLGFIKGADVPVVLIILTLLAVCLRSIIVPFDGRVTHLSALALVFAIPVTYLFSIAPESHWTTRLFWRAVLQNGAVSVVLWHLLLPRFLKRWPLHAPHPLPPPPTDAILNITKTADDQRRKDLWQEPVEKKKED